METPRDYQIEVFNMAKNENIIVVLPTGSGKILIFLFEWKCKCLRSPLLRKDADSHNVDQLSIRTITTREISEDYCFYYPYKNFSNATM